MALTLKLCFVFCLLASPICFAAQFSENTLVVLARNPNGPGRDGSLVLMELNYGGELIQTIPLAGYDEAATDNGKIQSMSLDSTGAILAIPLKKVEEGTTLQVCYGMNIRGELVDETKAELAKHSGCIIEGNDVWMNGVTNIAYMARGSSKSVTNQNIMANDSPTMYTMQLVGSTLYTTFDGKLKALDPIIKTGSAVFPDVGAMPSNGAFTVYKDKFYALNVNPYPELSRYSLQNNELVADWTFKLNIPGAYLGGLTVVETATKTHIFLVAWEYNLSFGLFYRVTDDGTTRTLDVQATFNNKYFLALGIPPKPSCGDGIKNQDETDVDCGGQICGACANDKVCVGGTDCSSTFCDPDGFCKTPTCSDGYINQDETSTDCGGSCPGCADGKVCNVNADCQSNFCPDGRCTAPTCDDIFLNQDETDVDCGGQICPPCANNKGCLSNSDCNSTFCDPDGFCKTPTCSDGYINQDETSTDCGGSCPGCANGKVCNVNADCQSNFCLNGRCDLPPPVAPPMDPPVDVPVQGQNLTTTPQTPSTSRNVASFGIVVGPTLFLWIAAAILAFF